MKPKVGIGCYFVLETDRENQDDLLEWLSSTGRSRVKEPVEHSMGQYIVCDEECYGRACRPKDFSNRKFTDCGADIALFKQKAGLV